MWVSISVALLATHILAGDGQRVPSTTWYLSDADWSDATTRGHFEALAGRLPIEYRKPGIDVSFHLKDAPAWRDGTSRLLAHVGRYRNRVVLLTKGLNKRLEEGARDVELFSDIGGFDAAAAYLTRRALVHELTHIVDRRMGLSRRSEWQRLSAWGPLSYLPRVLTPRPASDFVTAYGATSPSEDLATFSEVYFLPPPISPTDSERHPFCRMSQKFQFFQRTFSDHPHPAPNVECPGPEDVGMSADDVQSISIMWAAPTLSSLASFAGHLLVVIDIGDENEPRRHVFAMLADDEGIATGPLTYLLFGVMGGFPSKVAQDPFETVSLRYVQSQNRDISLFHWRLAPEEEARLLARLDELLLYWDRPYFFFFRNCSTIVTELWDATDEKPLRMPTVLPPDLVLTRLAREGRLVRDESLGIRALAPVTHALRLKRMRRAELRDVCGLRVRSASSRNHARRDQGYRELLAHAIEKDDDTCWSELASVVLLSMPLEQAIRASRALDEPTEMEGFNGALAAVRDHVPLEERVRIRRRLDEEVLKAGRNVESSSWASAYAPYVPVDVALELHMAGAGGPAVPLVSIRRDALDVRQGEPRMFAPARGFDLRLLSFKGGVTLTPPYRVTLEHQLLRADYQPEPLLGWLTPGVGLDLLRIRADGILNNLDAEWIAARGLLRLTGSSDGRRRLNAYAGLSCESRFRIGDRWTQLGAPVGLKATAWSTGKILAGIESQIEWKPAYTSQGSICQQIEHRHSVEVAVGRVAGAALRLRLSAGAVYDLIQEGFQLHHMQGSIGIRIETY